MNEQAERKNQWKVTNIAVFAGIVLCGIMIGILAERQIILGNIFKPESRITNNVITPTPVNDTITTDNIINLVNADREKEGLPDLSNNDQLQNAAKAKADDLLAKDYWAENTPDGKSPWIFVKNAGYSYEYAAMDLARGFTTAPDVGSSWMNSADDKANILNSHVTDIGVAIESGTLTEEKNSIIVVQILASRQQSVTNTVTSQPQTYTAPVIQPLTYTPAPTVAQKVMVNIDDTGGITHGSFYCYADKVNELSNLQNQIRIDDIAATSCDSIAKLKSSNDCISSCSNSSDFNFCNQQCVNSKFSSCSDVGSKVGNERKQLYTMVQQDCP